MRPAACHLALVVAVAAQRGRGGPVAAAGQEEVQRRRPAQHRAAQVAPRVPAHAPGPVSARSGRLHALHTRHRRSRIEGQVST